ncbi:RICIN domain-containing protein [Catenovulum sp. 2E275]|uniref:RICIN domain-containing protein n=1 Tax=Catenovulum sp. 2E275 TaxID=2980497 RepID=UPI0021D0054F|nr:RICIN domain-containing protein [Catenovulum sp. 2E275]MCU4676267.1 RICIN domain-containing protein [Catenovulum sp. 2E275]
MKILHTMLLTLASISTSVHAADWDSYPVPVNAGSGKTWQLQAVSDDFNYSSNVNNYHNNFTTRWHEGYINPWTGPGLTEWTDGHAYVNNGNLGIAATRKPGTDKVRAGSITSHATFTYPLYVEARAKISNLVLASDIWLLSADSTQEIDVLEAYGSDRPDQTWFAERIHLSHHVFIREPFQDYQPTDAGSWYADGQGTIWRQDFHRIGVYWRDPWHLEYYIDGKLVRTVSGANIIDPNNFTGGTGLSKPMHLIINTEDQSWRSDNGITPTDAELADTNKSIYWVDWIRVYKPVTDSSGGNSGSPVTPPAGTTSLQNRASSKCVDLAAGSNANGTNIRQWGCSTSNTNQDFTFAAKGGDWYELRTKHNKCVGVAGNSTANAANVIQWDCFNGNNLQFQPISKGNGWFELKAKHSNKCLEVANTSSSNGATIQQWQCTGANNQQFKFY